MNTDTAIRQYKHNDCKGGFVFAYDKKEIDKIIAALNAQIKVMKISLEEAKGFSEWVEILGRTDCEIYKHELKGSADLAIKRISKALE